MRDVGGDGGREGGEGRGVLSDLGSGGGGVQGEDVEGYDALLAVLVSTLKKRSEGWGARERKGKEGKGNIHPDTEPTASPAPTP